ncbi:hypothetical protein ESZ50_02215 [Weissella muntiaci]|uniref:Helicase ATP-binding domain-containing protein n=1 Tax=Weissella muntiaci TaxID=2508881 RepID=A0A6C2CAD4_9LACO|nr:hypothetical protein [Weissella muntiaci]TYC50502.1 hypothetical protein ESZ50_02215 [Weissella muntiaci]
MTEKITTNNFVFTTNWNYTRDYHAENQQGTEDDASFLYYEGADKLIKAQILSLTLDKLDYEKFALVFGVFGGSSSELQALRSILSMNTKVYAQGANWDEDSNDYDLKARKYDRAIVSRPASDAGKLAFNFVREDNGRHILVAYNTQLIDEGYITSNAGQRYGIIANKLRNAPFGIPILEEWEEPIFKYLVDKHELIEYESWIQRKAIDTPFYAGKLVISPDEAIQSLNEMLNEGLIKLPDRGDGSAMSDIKLIDEYMAEQGPVLLDTVRNEYQPLYRPGQDEGYTDEISQLQPGLKLYPKQEEIVNSVVTAFNAKQKAIIVQGEMSTGKTIVMSAIAQVTALSRGQKGYFAFIDSPSIMTDKWASELKVVIPDVESIVLKNTFDLIKFHRQWLREGSKKPDRPTFVIFSFELSRNSYSMAFAGVKSTLKMADKFEIVDGKLGQSTGLVGELKSQVFRSPITGKVLVTDVKSEMVTDEEGKQQVKVESMVPLTSEDLESVTSKNYKDLDGNVMWTPKVPTKYKSFSEFNSIFQEKYVKSVESNNIRQAEYLLNLHRQRSEQNFYKSGDKFDFSNSKTAYRRLSVAYYIFKQMKDFFDFGIVDEIHELKAGNSSQGAALGQLAKRAKHIIGGTGTLLGGFASDVYYTLWRLFPNLMSQNNYEYSNVTQWERDFGNIQKIVYKDANGNERHKLTSRGKTTSMNRIKKLPGISPIVFGKFLLQNTVNMSLKDVWTDAVEHVEMQPIYVPYGHELGAVMQETTHQFDNYRKGLNKFSDNFKYSQAMLREMEVSLSFPDNPFTDKQVRIDEKIVFDAESARSKSTLQEDKLLPKEEKLVAIAKLEKSMDRPMVVYIKDVNNGLPERLTKILSDRDFKVSVLKSNTTALTKRSQWLEDQVVKKHVDIIITNYSLVKVGLDLISTPTLLFYQLGYSYFDVAQAARRASRIGQKRKTETYYLAYEGEKSYQKILLALIAKKQQATNLINGNTSSDGLSAMLGGEESGSLADQVLKVIQGKEKLDDKLGQKSSSELWILDHIGKEVEPVDHRPKFTKAELKKQKVEDTNSLNRQSDVDRQTNNVTQTLPKSASITNQVTVDVTDLFSFTEDGEIQYEFVKNEKKGIQEMDLLAGFFN